MINKKFKCEKYQYFMTHLYIYKIDRNSPKYEIGICNIQSDDRLCYRWMLSISENGSLCKMFYFQKYAGAEEFLKNGNFLC